MNTQRTRVKICGITREQDALTCEQLGVDALGFVFCEASARNIDPAAAKAIAASLSPFTTIVGLFLNADVKAVESVLSLLPNVVPQFHGTETPESCERYGRPYIKAIGLGAGMPSANLLSEYENAGAFLFDSNAPGELGGTGHTFDWHKLNTRMEKPVVLAGGINVENVAKAIATVTPYAVDVSSGVEQAKGIKDQQKLRAFAVAVAEADAAKLVAQG